MDNITSAFQNSYNTKLDILLKYAFWIAQLKDSVMDKEKKCSIHSTGQEQGYSFVAAIITEKMSLSLADSVEAARLNRGFLWKRSLRYNFKSPSCN